MYAWVLHLNLLQKDQTAANVNRHGTHEKVLGSTGVTSILKFVKRGNN